MKIFVTGATGFVGRHLVKRLLATKHRLSVLVRNKKSAQEIAKPGLEIFIGDLGDKSVLEKALSGTEVVIHLAAIRSDFGYSQDDYYRVNVLGTKNMLEAAIACRAKHFVLISSVKAAHPITYYGESKCRTERIAKEYSRKKRLPLTIVRPAIIYGPDDHLDGMMPKFVWLVKKRLFLTVGSGKNRLHFVYIDDLIDGLISVLGKKGQGKTYTLAGERAISVEELVKLVAAEFKLKTIPLRIPVFLANFAGAVLEKVCPKEPVVTRNKVSTITSDYVYDISLAQKELGYSPKVNYQEGLKKTISWLKKQWR